MESFDLSACLDGYRGSGTLESSGEFTLSLEHAKKKLQEFTLPEPRLYVLNLVAASVTGGASFLNFRSDADELWMESDCQIADVRELEHLQALVFSSQGASSLKELAIALNGVLPLKPRVLSLQACDGKRAAKLEWDGRGFDYEEIEPTELKPALNLYVQEPFGYRVSRKFLAQIGGGMVPDSEEDAVFRYCNRCPVKITYNGKTANRPLILGKGKRLVFHHKKEFEPGHILADFGRVRASLGEYSGLLTIGGRLAPWVTLVYQGVNFRLPEAAFKRKGLRGVVFCDSLRKDLSQVQLVQDEAFQRLLGDIEVLADQYL